MKIVSNVLKTNKLKYLPDLSLNELGSITKREHLRNVLVEFLELHWT